LSLWSTTSSSRAEEKGSVRSSPSPKAAGDHASPLLRLRELVPPHAVPDVARADLGRRLRGRPAAIIVEERLDPRRDADDRGDHADGGRDARPDGVRLRRE
jgi:hypothetical protein